MEAARAAVEKAGLVPRCQPIPDPSGRVIIQDPAQGHTGGARHIVSVRITLSEPRGDVVRVPGLTRLDERWVRNLRAAGQASSA